MRKQINIGFMPCDNVDSDILLDCADDEVFEENPQTRHIWDSSDNSGSMYSSSNNTIDFLESNDTDFLDYDMYHDPLFSQLTDLDVINFSEIHNNTM